MLSQKKGSMRTVPLNKIPLYWKKIKNTTNGGSKIQ